MAIVDRPGSTRFDPQVGPTFRRARGSRIPTVMGPSNATAARQELGRGHQAKAGDRAGSARLVGGAQGERG